LYQGNVIRIRFQHIDCPENDQPYGDEATSLTAELCENRTVIISHFNDYDPYGRLIAEIITPQGDTVNRELVKAGYAWHYKRYSNDVDYASLENQARNSKVGLWTEKDPVAPWDWR
jgi:endonuclease YncB( thermonuclease family)